MPEILQRKSDPVLRLSLLVITRMGLVGFEQNFFLNSSADIVGPLLVCVYIYGADVILELVPIASILSCIQGCTISLEYCRTIFLFNISPPLYRILPLTSTLYPRTYVSIHDAHLILFKPSGTGLLLSLHSSWILYTNRGSHNLGSGVIQ